MLSTYKAVTHPILISSVSNGHMVGSRFKAMPLRKEVEEMLRAGFEVTIDFSNMHATQSFIDELVGGLILRFGPNVVEKLIFKSCPPDVQAIIEFVVEDRSEQYEAD